jgi:hypothetical protein
MTHDAEAGASRLCGRRDAEFSEHRGYLEAYNASKARD